MDYESLLESCAEMGCSLLKCGAEIHRVEDTIHHLLAAYHVEGEVFAIPNCLIISITDHDGHTLTRMRRAEVKGTDIQALEAYNALSRRLCSQPPADTGEMRDQIAQVTSRLSPYPVPIHLLGCFLGAAFFAIFFSGGWLEALVSGLAGLLAGGCALFLGRTRSNFFINTIVAGFVLAFTAYGLLALGVPVNIEPVIVGAIMVLVPGLVFTNFMSDLLTGDIVAGLSTFARAVLTAGAIALGTGAALALFRRFVDMPVGVAPPVVHSAPLACLMAFLACLGFCLTFNIRGVGMLLCCLGGALGWAAYLVVQSVGGGAYISSFVSSITVAVYAETMARIRKCPTTSYLVVSYFPLVPGFTIYQAMDYSIRGNTDLFLDTFARTFGIAGCIALGTLLVSTALRIIQAKRRH